MRPSQIERDITEWVNTYSATDVTVADVLCDNHPPENIAFTIIEPDGSSLDLTYGRLREESTRAAAMLRNLGIEKNDAVGVLMTKSHEYVIVLMGLWRLGAHLVPLFTAFAPKAIEPRVRTCKLVVVDPDQRSKLEPSDDLPAVRGWGTLRVAADVDDRWPDDHLYGPLMADAAGSDMEPVTIGGEGRLALLYTSGTTGAPKGVAVPVKALASFRAYLRNALDVQDGDTFWNAADPGWAYGLYFAILGPLAAGQRSLLLHDRFTAESTWRVLHDFGVTNFAAAPTIFRTLRGEPGTQGPVSLRRASSAGEPLTPEVLDWATENLGTTVRDHYGQTEHGMVIGNAWREGLAVPVAAGSMGRIFPGWHAAVLREVSDDIAPDGEIGRLGIAPLGSPLWWFQGYDNSPATTADRYTTDEMWYLTGDLAVRDDDGTFHFRTRDDDLIIASGYRISPLDVETALLKHTAVHDVAVVAHPDPIHGEAVVAFVVLNPETPGSEDLIKELQQTVKNHYAAHAYPRRIYFVDELPRTPSGKMQRFLLRKEIPVT
jgi:acetyl-CoA synthetase